MSTHDKSAYVKLDALGRSCRLGITRDELQQVLDDRLPAFSRWMNGQTMALCEGRLYDHDKREYREACGGVAHGVVVYEHDLRQFLRGGRPFD